jgi:hypothetical protein
MTLECPIATALKRCALSADLCTEVPVSGNPYRPLFRKCPHLAGRFRHGFEEVVPLGGREVFGLAVVSV